MELIAYKPTIKRKLGLLKGKIHIPDNFLDEDEEINALFTGMTDENSRGYPHFPVDAVLP